MASLAAAEEEPEEKRSVEAWAEVAKERGVEVWNKVHGLCHQERTMGKLPFLEMERQRLKDEDSYRPWPKHCLNTEPPQLPPKVRMIVNYIKPAVRGSSKPGASTIWFFDDNQFDNFPSPAQREGVGSTHDITFKLVPEPGDYERPAKVDKAPFGKLKDSFHFALGVEQLAELKAAIGANEVQAIVFDWDKTLSLIEGLSSSPSPYIQSCLEELKYLYAQNFDKEEEARPFKDITREELAEYFLSDPRDTGERLAALKDTLLFAQHKRIPIFILTNNNFAALGPKVLSDILWFGLGVKIDPLTNVVGGGRNYTDNMCSQTGRAHGLSGTAYAIALDLVKQEKKQAMVGGGKKRRTKRRKPRASKRKRGRRKTRNRRRRKTRKSKRH